MVNLFCLFRLFFGFCYGDLILFAIGIILAVFDLIRSMYIIISEIFDLRYWFCELLCDYSLVPLRNLLN